MGLRYKQIRAYDYDGTRGYDIWDTHEKKKLGVFIPYIADVHTLIDLLNELHNRMDY